MKYQEYTSNGHGRARGPAEIDSDLSAIRSEMSETLHLLEDKFSPRALIEQLFSTVRGAGHGSSELVSNLGATFRDNPVPLLLLASGVVSLIAADRTGAGRAARRGPRAGAGTMAGDLADVADAVDDAKSSVKTRAREVAGTVGERARDLRERASERASEIGERAGELRAHAQETSAAAKGRVRDAVHETRERGARTLQEEPLVIVGLGLAIGAVLGISVPVSERERRILGREGEVLVRRGEGAIGRAKEAVKKGVERATEVATTQPTERTQQRTEGESAPRATGEGAPVVVGVTSASSSVLVEPPPRVVGDPESPQSSGSSGGGTGER